MYSSPQFNCGCIGLFRQRKLKGVGKQHNRSYCSNNSFPTEQQTLETSTLYIHTDTQAGSLGSGAHTCANFMLALQCCEALSGAKGHSHLNNTHIKYMWVSLSMTKYVAFRIVKRTEEYVAEIHVLVLFDRVFS